jgi:hypothetical protein
MVTRFAKRFLQPAALLAIATFCFVLIRAIGTVDANWDTLAYHWPFAARLAGLCSKECFEFSFGVEARYEGFPLLLTTVQGWLWRLTGTPAWADLLNIALLLALCAYLRWRFAVPLAWSWLAFLAIPVVQIELTSSYIDLPVNAGVTLGIMVALRVLAEPGADHRLDLVAALVALGIAAGSKYQMLPTAIGIWCSLVALGTWKPSIIRAHHRLSSFALLTAAGALILLPKLVLNAVNFGNPLYPIDTQIGPIHLAGLEGTKPGNSISDYWADSSNGVRWVASIFEFDAFRGRLLPWTLGQGDVPQSSPSFRMGGYFVPYVLGAIVILFWSARTSWAGRRSAALFVFLSVYCAVLPLSHELRYYMFWMLTLISCVLAATYSQAFADPDQAVRRHVAQALIIIALVSVVSMTGGAYLQTDGQKLKDLLQGTDIVVAKVPEGGTLCVMNRNPRAFLFSSLFHPPRAYHTRSLFANESVECTLRIDPDPV